MKKRGGSVRSKAVGESFMGMLSIDVINARKRWEENDSESARRDLVRTMFAAIEGYVWEYRQWIWQAAKEIDNLPIMLELALLEKSYSVSETGKVSDQPRFVSLTAMFRLTTRIAARISPTLKVDFGDGGWESLKAALKVRHRITHPKTVSDLQILNSDIETAEKGFFWLLEVIAEVFRVNLASQKSYLLSFSEFFVRLQAGDPEAIAEYEKSILLWEE